MDSKASYECRVGRKKKKKKKKRSEREPYGSAKEAKNSRNVGSELRRREREALGEE